MKLKNILIAASIGVSSLLNTGCTHNFEEMNQDPWKSTDLNVKHILPFTQTKAYSNGHEGWRTSIIMTGPMSGISSTYIGTGSGFGENGEYTGAFFENLYRDMIRNIEDSKQRLKEDGSDEAMAEYGRFTVVNVINQLRATQLYGDIPYSTAGKGYTEGIYYPAYDRQEDVFEMMVEDLKEAKEYISKVERLADYDAYRVGLPYKEVYIKIIHSLYIKIGMMMSEANPTRGAEIFHLGYDTNDYIDSWNVAPVIHHTNEGGAWGSTVNGYGIANNSLVGGFSGNYFSPELLEYMQKNEDPRIFRLACHLDYSSSSTEAYTDVSVYKDFDPFAVAQTNEPGVFNKVHFRGLRLGSTSDGTRSLYKVEGQANQHIDFWANRTQQIADEGQFMTLAAISPEVFNAVAPTIILGADEVMFYIAEASTIPSYGVSDPNALSNAVELALSKYDAVGFKGGTLEDAFVDIYKKQTNPAYSHLDNKLKYVQGVMDRYNAAPDLEAKRELVITEHWASLTGDCVNAFSLVTRTGMPSFVNRNLTSTQMDFPLPVYDKDPLTNDDAVVTGTETVLLHTGGSTGGIRPYRFPYPGSELNANGTNAEEAIKRQRQETGTSEAIHFIAVPQWCSKR
ncbi:SusD/RagB family nutrient-binding outer membrane lipoprotein [Flammeovirga sp. OC4]|uniref:SusD/RagB family nutrient-binding outer membrane lipoprotein n=1 Tax=Flammeovirga sp. OC4 TaxID=1382345 RepID=UPI0005C54809|nr:SusD/RagB family nutrient-binding outer membrane lipoprotein [Flammeovirga sp. OC4]